MLLIVFQIFYYILFKQLQLLFFVKAQVISLVYHLVQPRIIITHNSMFVFLGWKYCNEKISIFIILSIRDNFLFLLWTKRQNHASIFWMLLGLCFTYFKSVSLGQK